MPIRLNLLAEAQALEDQRRRDPVKRAIWIGALLIALMLVWASSLQLKAILANAKLGNIVAQMNSLTNDYKKVIDTQRKITDINHRLTALHALSTNRFLYGNFLNALQQVAVDDIQLSQIKVEQSYAVSEGMKPRTNSNNTVLPGKPATITERVTLTLDGTDASPSPGDEVTRFKELLAKHPYFQERLGKTNQMNLKSLSEPQVAPDSGRAIVLFSLETQLPPKTR